jgi:hypothetical protein
MTRYISAFYYPMAPIPGVRAVSTYLRKSILNMALMPQEGIGHLKDYLFHQKVFKNNRSYSFILVKATNYLVRSYLVLVSRSFCLRYLQFVRPACVS